MYDTIDHFRSQVTQLVNINAFVQGVIENANNTSDQVGDVWKVAYGLIFSPHVSQKVFSLLSDLGMSLEYYDPDTTYEEDSRAFANALDEKLSSLSQVMPAWPETLFISKK